MKWICFLTFLLSIYCFSMEIPYYPIGINGEHASDFDKGVLRRIGFLARGRILHQGRVQTSARIAGTCGGIAAGIGTFAMGIAKLGKRCNRNAKLVVSTSFVGACFAGLLAAKSTHLLARKLIARRRRRELETEYQEIAASIERQKQADPRGTFFDDQQGLYLPAREYQEVELMRQTDNAAPFETALRNSEHFRNYDLGLNTLQNPMIRQKVENEMLEVVRRLEHKPRYSYDRTINFFEKLRTYAPSRQTVLFLGRMVEPTLRVIGGLLREQYRRQECAEQQPRSQERERQ